MREHPDKAPTSSPNPSHPLRILCVLPKEILLRMINNLDIPSSLSLARTSSAFRDLTLDRIWRAPEVSLCENYGRHPSILPCAPDSKGFEYLRWTSSASTIAGKRYVDRMVEKWNSLGRCGEIRSQFGLIRCLSLYPSVMGRTIDWGSGGMILLLKSARENLRGLDILGPGRMEGMTFELPIYDFFTLDSYIIKYSMTFPALVHVYLGDQAVILPQLIPHICSIAPNILSFDVDLDPHCYSRVRGAVEQSIAKRTLLVTADTKIAKLRLSLHDEYDPLSKTMTVSPTLLSLLSHCPSLQHLTVHYTQSKANSDNAFKPLIKIIAGLGSLECLSWTTIRPSADTYSRTADRVGDDRELLEFASLKGLVFTQTEEWKEVFSYLPAMPKLEMVYYEPGPASFSTGIATHTPDAATSEFHTHLSTLSSPFLSQIRRCPRLQDILPIPAHIDQNHRYMFDELKIWEESRG